MNSENIEMEETMSEDPENITLVPAEERAAKARCTIRTSRIKQEQESEDEAEEVQRAIANADHKNVYMMEVTSNSSSQGETLKLQPIGDTMGNKYYIYIYDFYIVKFFFLMYLNFLLF